MDNNLVAIPQTASEHELYRCIININNIIRNEDMNKLKDFFFEKCKIISKKIPENSNFGSLVSSLFF